MKNFLKISLIALTMSPLVFTGCKKGEGDPFISLKTRKARLAGEWTVTAGKGTDVNSSFSTSWTYDGTQKVTTYPSPLPQGTDKFTMSYTIEKDGTFETVYVDNDASPAETTTATGTWNFTGGVGEYKNKSQVVFTTLSITNSGGSVTYTGSDGPTEIMDLYQLKNDEVIVKYKGSTSSPSSSSEGEWTWTAK